MPIQLANKGYEGYVPNDTTLQKDTNTYNKGTAGGEVIWGTVLFNVAVGSKLRFKCEMRSVTGTQTAVCTIRFNGIDEFTWTEGGNVFVAKEQDQAISLTAGSEISVYLQCPGGGANKSEIKNFEICGSRCPIILT